MKYYRRNSMPLIELDENHVRAGELVYNELGKCVKKVYINDNVYFIEVVESALNDGELLSKLDDKQLSLFWTLSKNILKAHENKNKS